MGARTTDSGSNDGNGGGRAATIVGEAVPPPPPPPSPPPLPPKPPLLPPPPPLRPLGRAATMSGSIPACVADGLMDYNEAVASATITSARTRDASLASGIAEASNHGEGTAASLVMRSGSVAAEQSRCIRSIDVNACAMDTGTLHRTSDRSQHSALAPCRRTRARSSSCTAYTSMTTVSSRRGRIADRAVKSLSGTVPAASTMSAG